MDDNRRTQQVEATLALAVDAPPADGPRPDAAEIAAWHEGRLSTDRATQVKAHIARDPELFAIWSALLDAEESIADLPDPKPATWRPTLLLPLLNWFRGGSHRLALGGLGAVAVAVVFSVVLVSRLQPTGILQLTEDGYQLLGAAGGLSSNAWPFAPVAQIKGLNFWMEAEESNFEIDRRAFLVGVRSGLEALTPLDDDNWRAIVDNLPTAGFECSQIAEPERCQTRQDLMQQTGRWSALIYAACNSAPMQTKLPPTFWQQHRDAASLLAVQFREAGIVSPFTRILSRATDTDEPAQMAVCAGARALMGEAFAE